MKLQLSLPGAPGKGKYLLIETADEQDGEEGKIGEDMQEHQDGTVWSTRRPFGCCKEPGSKPTHVHTPP